MRSVSPSLSIRSRAGLELLLRDRRSCHLAAVVLGRVNRQSSPAAAYFQQVIFGPKVELAADADRFFPPMLRSRLPSAWR